MGFSVAKGGKAFHFADVNDAIIAFLEKVVRAPAILAFSCVAGLGAVDIAARRPDLASRLVLIQTPSWDEEVKWKKSRDPKKIIAKPFVGQFVMRSLKKSRAPMWFDLALSDKADKPAFCACAAETLAHGAGWELATAFQLYLRDQRPPIPKLRQPILAIWGKADRSHPATPPALRRRARRTCQLHPI
ncbi:MAG: alpha/beta hydrolase [Rhodomicrobium sp.]|nr:alpha/beta hydrolase [Rhodomicrobium sp.]